jgi:6-phosphogluconate dehydrogenase
MDLGMIGLGKMGGYMTERLVKGGHRVVGYDRDASIVKGVVAQGGVGADSLESMVKQLPTPRAVWLMVPHEVVDPLIESLLKLLSPGDTIIDGGNSFYKESIRRAAYLAPKKIHFVDVGTSGGVWGLKEGYSMMVGGPDEAVQRLTPIFETLAPAANLGWGHTGPAGAGHYVKMVHNGIEYAMMLAYAEGLDLLRHKKDFSTGKDFNINLEQVSQIWRTGSVIRSWLLDLIADGLKSNPTLDGISAVVADTGEGRWTAIEGIELGVPLATISAALDRRMLSQDPDPFANKLLSMMRHQFGGHAASAAAKSK